ncbi:hypothetical protein LTR65_003963 [Meristemomyces frigidus]
MRNRIDPQSQMSSSTATPDEEKHEALSASTQSPSHRGDYETLPEMFESRMLVGDHAAKQAYMDAYRDARKEAHGTITTHTGLPGSVYSPAQVMYTPSHIYGSRPLPGGPQRWVMKDMPNPLPSNSPQGERVQPQLSGAMSYHSASVARSDYLQEPHSVSRDDGPSFTGRYCSPPTPGGDDFDFEI